MSSFKLVRELQNLSGVDGVTGQTIEALNLFVPVSVSELLCGNRPKAVPGFYGICPCSSAGAATRNFNLLPDGNLIRIRNPVIRRKRLVGRSILRRNTRKRVPGFYGINRVAASCGSRTGRTCAGDFDFLADADFVRVGNAVVRSKGLIGRAVLCGNPGKGISGLYRVDGIAAVSGRSSACAAAVSGRGATAVFRSCISSDVSVADRKGASAYCPAPYFPR